MDEFIKLCANAYRRRYFLDGLLIALVVVSAMFWSIGFKPDNIYKAGSWLFVYLVIGNIWGYIRRVPRFPKDRIGVLLSSQGDEDVEKDVEYIEQEIRAKIKGSKYSSLFIVKRLPENRIVRDAAAANAIRQKSGALVFIWGTYSKGRISGKEYRGFAGGKLNFTYPFPAQYIQYRTGYQKDIGCGVAGRAWMFASENELIEREFVVDNIFDVARYIVASCLLYFGNLHVGKGLLKEIIVNPSGKWIGKSERAVVEFVQNIKSKMAWVDVKIAQQIYNSHIFVDGVLFRDEKLLNDILKHTEASLNNSPSAEAYLLRAIAYFLKGDLKCAKDTALNIKKREPKNPAPEYSLAFLYAYEGDLKRAERRYVRALDATHNATADFISHILQFPYAVLRLEPNRVGVHYALGLLHKELADKMLAAEHFNKFIEEAAKQSADLSEWTQKANAYLKQLACVQSESGS
ncbi:MAG: hypothetical protein PHV33_08755 [Elusimicrobiales bacterium]|nr:hypothetical protein [Elusimicrobiales bacterium]